MLPVLAGMAAADVTTNDIMRVLHRFTAGNRNSKIGANRCRGFMHAAWAFALSAKFNLDAGADVPDFGIAFNVVSPTKGHKAEKAGNRNLTWDELKVVWHTVEDSGMCDQYRQALRFLLATGQRVEEVLGMRRPEIVIDAAGAVWLIPASRRKNGKEHDVPLTEWQRCLLPESGSDLIFGRGGVVPSSVGLRQAVDRIWRQLNIEKFTPRDSRRTWKTLAGDAGLDLEVRNRVQGHAFTDIGSAHCDRHSYAKEKRLAMERWCDRLRQQLDGRSNVVAMAR